MKPLRHRQTKNYGGLLQGQSAFILFVFFWLGGCSIWNGYLDSDYESSRADRLCHPFGQCSQGIWVAGDGTVQDSTLAKVQCQEVVDQRYRNEWWADSVARGLEIGSCMEKKGYTLQQWEWGILWLFCVCGLTPLARSCRWLWRRLLSECLFPCWSLNEFFLEWFPLLVDWLQECLDISPILPPNHDILWSWLSLLTSVHWLWLWVPHKRRSHKALKLVR